MAELAMQAFADVVREELSSWNSMNVAQYEVTETDEVVYSPVMTDKEVERIAQALHSLQSGAGQRGTEGTAGLPVASTRMHRAGTWIALIVGVVGILTGIVAGLNYIVGNAIRTELNSKDGLSDRITSVREAFNNLQKDFQYLRKDVDSI
jgi:hypothetical protein